jgi:predicted extracellular nuclease
MNNNYQPISKRTGASGDTTITTFNLYNLFAADEEVQVRINGEWQRPLLPIQLAKLSLAIQFELALPAIVAVQEVGSEAVLQQLADKVNEVAGTDYRAISPPTSDRRGIQIGFLYDRKRVDLVQAFQLSGAAVDAAFGPKSPNPGREPLVGLFQVAGEVLIVINNHFKSNYIPDELTDQTKKLLRANLAQRTAQAQVVRDYVTGLLAENPAALVVVMGDLNTSKRGGTQEDLLASIRILTGVPPELQLTNLLPLKKDIFEYTFIWEGENEILDHILVSPALLERFVGVDVLHFNAAYSEAMWLAGKTAVRCSDHDPLEARFKLMRDA